MGRCHHDLEDTWTEKHQSASALPAETLIMMLHLTNWRGVLTGLMCNLI